MRAELAFYSQPGPTTDLTGYTSYLEPLGTDPAALAAVVANIYIHEFTVQRHELVLPEDRLGDVQLVGASTVMRRILEINDAPLLEPRAPSERVVGFCYHPALLLCAFLRAKGVPARARCGFASYLVPDVWSDHWIAEYWTDEGWIAADPDTGRARVAIGEDFLDGGAAWNLCRTRNADPSTFGNGALWGWDELRGSLISDLGALNKVEVAIWETWCRLIDREDKALPDPELDDRLDRVAEAITSKDHNAIRASYESDPELQPPASLLK